MTKEELIEKALAKLTEEEKQALGLIKKPRVKKNYNFTIYYTIGDADGNTQEKTKISLNNPLLSILDKCLSKLEAAENRRSIQFNDDCFKHNLKKNNITQVEYNILYAVSYLYLIEDEENEALNTSIQQELNLSPEDYWNFLFEFDGLFQEDSSYSILSYSGHKIT